MILENLPTSQLEQVTAERDSLKSKVHELELQLKEKDILIELLRAQMDELKKPSSAPEKTASPASKLNASMNVATPIASPISSTASAMVSPESSEKIIETFEDVKKPTKKRGRSEAEILLEEHEKLLSPSRNKKQKQRIPKKKVDADDGEDDQVKHRKDNWAAPPGAMRHRKSTNRLTYADATSPTSSRAAPSKKRAISPPSPEPSDSEASRTRRKHRRLN